MSGSFFSLPFKGRVGWGWCWFSLHHLGERLPTSSSRRRPGSSLIFCFSRQPTHVPVFFTRHPWRASHFLLLAQEKVTKEKGTPEVAVGLWPTARGRCGGLLTGHPWPDSEPPQRPRRAQGGPRNQKPVGQGPPYKSDTKSASLPPLAGEGAEGERGRS